MGYHPAFVFIYTPIQPRNIDLLRVSIYPSSRAAADIGYGNIGYCPTSVSIYPPCQPEIWDMGCASYVSVSIHPPLSRRYRIWDIAQRPCLSIPFSNPEIWIWPPPAPPLTQAKFLHVSSYLSPFPAQNIGYGI